MNQTIALGTQLKKHITLDILGKINFHVPSETENCI